MCRVNEQAPPSVCVMCGLYPVLSDCLWHGLVASCMDRSHVLGPHPALRLAGAYYLPMGGGWREVFSRLGEESDWSNPICSSR